MRKITEQAINAFLSGEKFSSSNTQIVLVSRDKNLSSWKKGEKELAYYTSMILHGNHIATHYEYLDGSSSFTITNAGYFTNVTKERLNGIPGVRIQQKKGKWYLNDATWSGAWTTITPR